MLGVWMCIYMYVYVRKVVYDGRKIVRRKYVFYFLVLDRNLFLRMCLYGRFIFLVVIIFNIICDLKFLVVNWRWFEIGRFFIRNLVFLWVIKVLMYSFW